jgi:hypothetical protein
VKTLLLHCYPASWRARYGDEFEAILDEAPLGPFDVADILLGALDARLRHRRGGATIGGRKEFFMSLRIGGAAATIAASIWTVLFIATGSLQGQPFGGGVAILAFAGLLALLVAVAGLSAYQMRSHPKLIWTAFALMATGTVAMAVGAAVDLAGIVAAGWNVIVVAIGGLVAILGSALFGIATYRASTLSRAAAMLLVAGPASAAFALLLAPVAPGLAYLFVLPAGFCLLAGWFALGVSAIRLDRTTSAPRPA